MQVELIGGRSDHFSIYVVQKKKLSHISYGSQEQANLHEYITNSLIKPYESV